MKEQYAAIKAITKSVKRGVVMIDDWCSHGIKCERALTGL